MTDKMREEFEAWAKPIGFDVDYIYADDAFKCYCFTATQNAFDAWKSGWQASRAALCVELPKQYSTDSIGSAYCVDAVIDSLDSAGVRYK